MMATGPLAPLAFAPTASRINALEMALQMIIEARKVGKVPPLLADAIDLAERVLDEGAAFPRIPVLNNTTQVQP